MYPYWSSLYVNGLFLLVDFFCKDMNFFSFVLYFFLFNLAFAILVFLLRSLPFATLSFSVAFFLVDYALLQTIQP